MYTTGRFLASAMSVGVLFLAAAGHAQGAAKPEGALPKALLAAPEGQLPGNITASGAVLSLNKGAAPALSENAIRIDFPAQSYDSRVTIRPGDTAGWSQLGQNLSIALDLHNPGTESVHVYFSIRDAVSEGTRMLNVAPGETQAYFFELNGGSVHTDTGMRDVPNLYAGPPRPMIWAWGNKTPNVDGLAAIELMVKSILIDRTLVLDNLRLADTGVPDADGLLGTFDEFGQHAKRDWPGKTQSLKQMKQAAATELQQLADSSALPDRSTFGGWATGPKLAVTGYFRTEKVDGKWALVDPEGYLFFSTGLANARMANAATMTGIDYRDPQETEAKDRNLPVHSIAASAVRASERKGSYVASELRRNLFQWLPDYDEPLARHYGYRTEVHSGPLLQGETFSFYPANLERKYGADFFQHWLNVTVQRMLAWGFTSLGNWADPAYYGNRRIPYAAHGWILGDHARVSSGTDYWGPLHDPFDPQFIQSVRKTVEQVAAEVQGEPWCIGVFIENELSWGNTGNPRNHYGVIMHTLTRDAGESPAKRAFTAQLKEKYGNDVQALNAAWGTEVASWRVFANGFAPTGEPTEGMLEDYGELLFALASKYFSIVRDELRRAMPNHLFLGSRFADWGMTPEVVRAAAEHVDVVSYNFYTEGLAADRWNFLADVDMPSIIGEFHFGALDVGLFHPGIVSTANQAERAKRYREYMHSVIDNPYFVGAHWFQYTDSPASGRAWDGENYNVGFVSITDTPYPQMVEAALEVNIELYERRFGAAETPRQ